MKPVIIGQAPAEGCEDRSALNSSSGWRLASWAGVSTIEFLATTDRCNVLQRWPGRAPSGGDLFPAALARQGGAELAPRLKDRVVIFLGRGVSAAVGCDDAPADYRWHACEATGAYAIVIPHPSGLNRVYNDPEHRARAGAAVRQAIGLARGEAWAASRASSASTVFRRRRVGSS